MTISINGTNGLIQAYDYQVLTTAFTYTFAAGTQVLVINPAGTLATGTITMPASPSDGMTITVESTQQVTALTMSGNGGTVVGAAVQLIPNQPLSWVYRATGTTWYPFFGGAGRASGLVSGTVQTAPPTTPQYFDFTGLPTWVKRVTLSFSGLSTNGTSPIRIQIGPVGGISATGYAGSGSAISTASAAAVGTSTAGFDFNDANSAAASRHGSFVLTLIDSSINLWAASSVFGLGNQSLTGFFGGAKTLTGALSILRVTTVNGTDTFDAGSINILYE